MCIKGGWEGVSVVGVMFHSAPVLQPVRVLQCSEPMNSGKGSDAQTSNNNAYHMCVHCALFCCVHSLTTACAGVWCVCCAQVVCVLAAVLHGMQ